MAVQLSGSGQYLQANTSVFSGHPMSWGGWFMFDQTSRFECLLCIRNSSTFEGWDLRKTAANRITANNFNGSDDGATSTTSVTSGVWYHLGGVHSAIDVRSVFVNGTAESTSNNSAGLGSTPNRTVIGGFVGGGSPLDGMVAEVGVWNVGLTSDEMAMLADGLTPLAVRPANLVHYYSLIRPNGADIMGAAAMTVNGSPTAAAHPRIFYPRRRLYVVQGGLVTSTVVPVDAAHPHTADATTFAQAHVLAPQDGTHAHAADGTSLDAAATVEPQDAVHGHTAESVTLSQAHALAPADASHAHTTDATTLAQSHTVAPVDAVHAHEVEQAAVTQAHALAPVDAAHGHVADAVELGVAGALSVQDSAHGHTADNVTLTVAQTLSPNDAAHAHASESTTVETAVAMLVHDASHGHAVDLATWMQGQVLLVQDAAHEHIPDTAEFGDQAGTRAPGRRIATAPYVRNIPTTAHSRSVRAD